MAESRSINFEEISNLDKHIDVLLGCKPLPESQIKILCDKVSILMMAGRVYFKLGSNDG